MDKPVPKTAEAEHVYVFFVFFEICLIYVVCVVCAFVVVFVYFRVFCANHANLHFPLVKRRFAKVSEVNLKRL